MIVGAQGEVIEQQFGEKELCFRTLDLYTSAVLEASLNPTTPPKPEWRQAMERMSEVTANACSTLPWCCHATCLRPAKIADLHTLLPVSTAELPL